MCFLIPILFTKQTKKVSSENLNIENIEEIKNDKDELYSNSIDKSIYDYKEYATIKLLHTKTNTIEEISLDEYLYGVVSSEMPASFEEEALKAQAVVARTYTIYKIQNGKRKT